MIEHKLCDSEVKSADAEDLTVEHWISTESEDRGRDVLMADGVVIDGVPVVLKSHGRDPKIGDTPIAKNIWIKPGLNKKGIRGLLAKTEFYPDEIGKDLWKRTTTGYAPYWSVGWSPIDCEFVRQRDGHEIRLVSKWKLYEYSLVGCGMQQDAVTPDPRKAFHLMSFKVMPSEQEKGTVRSHLHEMLKSGEKLTINIPDDFVDKTVQKIVKRELDCARGKVF